MKDDRTSGSAEEIISKILDDGRAQAKRLIDNAKRSEASEKRKAEAEAKKIRDEIMKQADAKARAVRSKELATANIEAKRELLRAREDAITKVLLRIAQDLARVREHPEQYRQALLNLASEAVAAVGGVQVTLRVGVEDKGLADQSFLDEIKAALEAKSGDQVEISLEIDPALSGGGCVAVSKRGRIVFDNTYRRRLERMKPQLRSLIVREVLKTDV
jgi:vacuolar-type H+-ATPase subunit E/Vma4